MPRPSTSWPAGVRRSRRLLAGCDAVRACQRQAALPRRRGARPEAEILRGGLRRPSEATLDARGPRRCARSRCNRPDRAEARAGGAYQGAAELADDLERYLAASRWRARRKAAPINCASSFRATGWRCRWRSRRAGPACGLAAALWQAGLAREQAQRAAAMSTFVLSLIRQATPTRPNRPARRSGDAGGDRGRADASFAATRSSNCNCG